MKVCLALLLTFHAASYQPLSLFCDRKVHEGRAQILASILARYSVLGKDESRVRPRLNLFLSHKTVKSPFFFEEKALDRWNYQGIESSVVLDRWHSLEHCIWRSGRARWIDRLIIGRASMPPAASSRAGSLPLLGIHLLGSRPPDLRPGLPISVAP